MPDDPLAEIETLEVVSVIRNVDGELRVDTQLDDDTAIALLTKGVWVLCHTEVEEEG